MGNGVFRFYRWDGDLRERLAEAPTADLNIVYWRPSWLRPLPTGCRSPKFLVWFVFDRTRVFASKGYGVLLVRKGGRVVHRSCVFPRFFRFPFMAVGDLQIGDVWTAPSTRRQGLATVALEQILRIHTNKGSTLWYLVEETNQASIKVAERNGFQLAGFGTKHPRWGLRFFGRYTLDESRSSGSQGSTSRPATGTTESGDSS